MSPDPDVLIAMEPDELGLRMLPLLRAWKLENRMTDFSVENVVRLTFGDAQYGNNTTLPRSHWQSLMMAVREAWAWLEGAALLIPDPGYVQPHPRRILSRRAARLATEPDPRRVFSARRIPKESLNHAIREGVWSDFHLGRYDMAVFAAMKAVEVAVRDASGLPANVLGVALMRRPFDPDNGPLADMSAEKGEREARAHLFAGALGSYKNPQSHRQVDLDDPDEAAELIMLANHLLRIVDGRRGASGG